MFTKLLKDTNYLDYNHPNITEYLKDYKPKGNPKEDAISLYLKVRDDFLYDPYKLDLTDKGLKASNVVQKKRAWCVEKALLLTACLRKLNIPARVGYANVINHIGVDRLAAILKSEVIACHGYTEVYLDNKWVKCTPAFDRRICKLSGVEPLAFDGENDSLFQAYDNGLKFMEYVSYHGEFDDVPKSFIQNEMRLHYPHLFKENIETKSFTFIFK